MNNCQNSGKICAGGLPNAHQIASTNILTTVLNIVAGITASIALLIIVIAGFRYVIARGDPSATAQARETIIYAVTGLVITIAAYGIVLFVIKGLS